MCRISAIVLITVAALATLAPRMASAQQKPQPSFNELIAAGYEIKNVAFVPEYAVKTMGGEPDHPPLIVTLQKGASTAVCIYNAITWSNQSRASLESTTQCSTYPPW
jgi:hypothetical protein